MSENDTKPASATHNVFGGVSNEQLKTIVQRVERLEEKKRNIGLDIAAIYAEAKSNGFNTGIIKSVVKMRKLSDEKRQETQHLFDTYMAALGELPLFH